MIAPFLAGSGFFRFVGVCCFCGEPIFLFAPDSLDGELTKMEQLFAVVACDFSLVGDFGFLSVVTLAKKDATDFGAGSAFIAFLSRNLTELISVVTMCHWNPSFHLRAVSSKSLSTVRDGLVSQS